MNGQGDAACASPPHYTLVINSGPAMLLTPHPLCLGIEVCLHASPRLEESLDNARLRVGRRTKMAIRMHVVLGWVYVLWPLVSRNA